MKLKTIYNENKENYNYINVHTKPLYNTTNQLLHQI